MNKISILLVLIIGFAFVAIGITTLISATPAESANTLPPTYTPRAPSATPSPSQPAVVEVAPPAQAAQTVTLPETTLTDEQGAIIVEITPLNSSEARNTLNFIVGMNTHSIDLSMDLAPLSTLTTDNGMNIPAILWDAPRGGHHLEGNLSFAVLQDDMALLAGATTLTLTIKDLDAPERIFTWDLQK